MTDLSETTLSSEQLVDGKLLKVYRDEVRLPDGKTSVREWIDHPGASAIVPLFDDGKTLLLRQFRYPSRQTFLEVPAGKIDHDGEAPIDVAARELEEETGWRAGTLLHVGALHPCIGYSNEVIHLFLAQELQKGERNLEPAEFAEVIPVAFDEAVAMARSGRITDMKSVAALLLVEAHLQAGSEKMDGRTPR